MRERKTKIVSPDMLATLVHEAKLVGKKVVHCHGVFDLVHPGHINYFEQARFFGELVYVGVLADRFVRKGPGRPRFSQDVRLKWVAALECVDFVVLNDAEEGPWSLMRIVRPDFYTKGESDKIKLDDPKSLIHRDMSTMQEIGGDMRFTPEIDIHSTDLFRTLE